MDSNGRLTIGIYGAFDRFNYGDLLFPIVIKKALDERLSNIDYKYYGIVDSDLSMFGGIPTTAIRRRLKAKTMGGSKEIFVIAGGEVLNTNMFYLYQCLTKNQYVRKIFNKLYRTFGRKHANNLCRYLLASKLILPYIVNKELFPGVECCIYNTVGGNLPEEYLELARCYLQKSDFISVRDKETQENIAHAVPNVKPCLFPDSVSVISKFFTKDILLKMVSSSTIEFLNSHQDGYICFQISYNSYRINPAEINKQLEKLFKKTKLPILLLPIGRAPWHHDQFSLKQIKVATKNDYFMPTENTIWDIMTLIANAKLFIGTSLHGIITSMSYSVPYVPINPDIKKVKRYLDTWGSMKGNYPIEYSLICDASINALDADLSILKKYQRCQIERVEENFDLIADCIRQYL